MAHVERHVRKLPAEPPDLLLTLLTICRALSLSLGQAQGRLPRAPEWFESLSSPFAPSYSQMHAPKQNWQPLQLSS